MAFYEVLEKIHVARNFRGSRIPRFIVQIPHKPRFPDAPDPRAAHREVNSLFLLWPYGRRLVPRVVFRFRDFPIIRIWRFRVQWKLYAARNFRYSGIPRFKSPMAYWAQHRSPDFPGRCGEYGE